MDKKKSKQTPPTSLNNTQVTLFKRLAEYEQNIIQYLRSQTDTIKIIEETNKNETDKLKALEGSFAKYFEQTELVEVYKGIMQSGLNSIQISFRDINQAIHDTCTTLIKLDGLGITIENGIKEKQAKNKRECGVLEKNLHVIKEELRLIELTEAIEQNEWDVTFSKTKNDVDDDYRFIKIEETEITGSVNEENEIDNQLTLKESDINILEQREVNLNLETKKIDVEAADLEENLNQCKFELDEIKLNVDKHVEAELDVKNYIQKVQSEISAIDADNAKLEDDEIFQLLIDEKKNHNVKVADLEECINKLKQHYLSLESEVSKEETAIEHLREESSQLDSEVDNNTQLLTKISNETETFKNKDTSQIITECKKESKATFDQILLKSTEINEIKRQVADLESALASIPVINEDDIALVNQEIINLKREVDDKIVQTDEELKEFTSNQNHLKENRKKEVIEKIEMTQKLTKDLNVKIEELLHVEKTTNITYQASLVECDVFAKKLKEKMTNRHNLKKKIVNFNKPAVPQHRKRTVDEFSEASDTAYDNFSNIHDIQKYIMAKKLKKNTGNN